MSVQTNHTDALYVYTTPLFKIEDTTIMHKISTPITFSYFTARDCTCPLANLDGHRKSVSPLMSSFDVPVVNSYTAYVVQVP
jgi:hypothetical protein